MLRAMLLRLAGIVGGVIIFAVTFELSVLLFSPGLIAASQPPEDIVSKWSNFDRELNAFLSDTSGIEALQEAYDEAAKKGKITFKPVNGKQLVQEIAKSLGDLFAKRVQALQIAVKHAEKIAADYKWDNTLKKVDCLFAKALNDTVEPFAYDKLYDKIVSIENSSIHIPVDIFNGTIDILNSIAWTSGLDEVWKKNREEDPSLVWQYFGSRTGMLRSFPATSWKYKTPVDLYDVRRSKWYTQGVSSPKDMLILIEKSGSSHGQALKLIQHSVKSLIDTLSENDFVNIANFSDKAALTSCFRTFVQATERNKKILKPAVDTVVAGQVANYVLGFEFAFQQFAEFSEDQGASCNRIIMLFTDGTSDVPVDVFQKYNPNKKIRVFSYAVGPMAGDRSIQTRQIGCSNRGLFYPIPAMGAIRAQVQDYVNILSGGISAYNGNAASWSNVYDDIWDYLTVLAPTLAMASGADKISWTSLHRDEMDMGLVLAVTMPVFGKANWSNSFNESLLGMMGVDVTLEELKNKTQSDKLAPNGYAFGLNPNGIVIFHPVLDNFKADIESASPVIDFAEIGEDTPEKEQIRKEMIDQLTNSIEITEFVTAPDGKHDLRVNQTYHYTAIPGTNFSVAVVIPEYVRNYISEKQNITLKDGIELLRTNESQLLFNTTNICKPVPLDTNETYESTLSILTLEELVELLSLNANDCDAKAVQKLLFDVMITSHLEDKWTGKERRREEKRDSSDLSSYAPNHDQKRDVTDLVTNEPTRDQMQDSSDSVSNDPTHYQMQDDSLTNDPTRDSRDSGTDDPTHDEIQDSRDSVTNDPTHYQMQDSRDSVTHDEKRDSTDLIFNEAISDVEADVANESSFNRLKRNAMQSMDVIYAQFVTTGKDFTRVRRQSTNGYEAEEEKKELKTFMENLHERSLYDDVWIFALYPEGSGKGDNASLIFASKTVSLKENNYRAATVGVQLTLQNFSALVSTYESNCCNSLPEGSVLYILDDGGFVLWQNGDEESVGKFFGSVEGDVMKALIDGGIYEGRAHTNYQAICIDVISRSAGFRIVPPFIYEILSLNWWTTATTWTYMNIMNLYSWLFTTQVPYVEALEDITKERSCIKSSYQYHFGNSSKTLSGDTGCDNCTRSFAASRLNSTNLLMVAIYGDSCNCEGLNITFPSNEENGADSLISRYSEINCTAKVRYRRKPPCHEPHEPSSYCGAASIFFTSHYHITLLVSIVLTKLLPCHSGGH